MDNGENRYAGFWLRVLAFLIDSILVILVLTPLLALIKTDQAQALDISTIWQMDPEALNMLLRDMLKSYVSSIDFWVSLLFPAIAAIIFWKYKSATPGKMIVKIRIVDAKTGERPGVAQCAIRYIGYYPAFLLMGLGVLWVAVDKRKRGWHDMISGTVVIKDTNHCVKT